MQRRSFHLLLTLLCGAFLVFTGCDFSDSSTTVGTSGVDPGVGPGPGTGPSTIDQPLLTGLEITGGGEEICAGSAVTLIGLNFSSNLTQNEVRFRAGSALIPGIPLEVSFPSDGNESNGLESRLSVLVPTGVISGSVELWVGGTRAGSRGYSACPQIYVATLGVNGDQEALEYLGPLGFNQGTSFIQLWGTNFGEIEDVLVSDGEGNEDIIPTNTIQRNVCDAGVQQEPTGYQCIGFSLNDGRNDVRGFNFPNDRDNLRIQIRGPSGLSNIVEVPVIDPAEIDLTFNPEDLGLCINAVKVPTGVRTGPVRIHYSIYEAVASAAWRMNVEWSVDDDSINFPNGERRWFPAKPLESDPEHSGVDGITCGSVVHPSQHRLFPGPGLVRIFSWDAPHDPNFCAITQERAASDDVIRRDWVVTFRLRPELDIGGQSRPAQFDHEWVTPSIVYYYMEELAGSEIDSQLSQEYFENFATDARKDSDTTANWGPPVNPNALTGRRVSDPNPFGSGTAEMVLALTNTPGFDEEFFTINTSRMEIVHVLRDNGDPTDENDDVVQTNTLTFPNPGATADEFHFTTFTIAEGTEVQVRGEHPLVIRLLGLPGGSIEDVVFECRGRLICSGLDGTSSPDDEVVPFTGGGAPGGRGGPGGGDGGDGGTILWESLFSGRLVEVFHAERGGNQGGEGGETTGAFHFDDAQVSRFWGGPGGGGGNRRFGGNGDTGNPPPEQYQPARPGRGGAPRGEPLLLRDSPGSGGGGGGATLGRVTVPGLDKVFIGMGGAGGGGGGGAVRLVANGSVLVGDDGTVEANGGNGGHGFGVSVVIPPDTNAGPVTGAGAGGGGSGGSIAIQASGFIDAGCKSLQVRGGRHGDSGRANRDGVITRSDQNLIPGSGAGSPGWIRLESRLGGSPSCGALMAESQTAECLRASTTDEFQIVRAPGFPQSGVVVLKGAEATSNCNGSTENEVVEEIFYFSVRDDGVSMFLEGLVRGINGTEAKNIFTGATVSYRGAISPLEPDILSDGGVVPAPNPVQPSLGSDGELHVRFIPSLDPDSGDFIRNERGEIMSIWTFDTDVGSVRDASGGLVIQQVRAAPGNPGFLDLSRLRIDVNTVLRGIGSNPMVVSISGEADIAGIIDVSGGDGEGVRTDPLDGSFLHGRGGRSGPGGGGGGDGGRIQYVDDDASNKDPENTIPIHGQPGFLPEGTPSEFDRTPVPYGTGDPAFQQAPTLAVTRATPGSSIRGQPCDTSENPQACTSVAGGGAGGGNNGSGQDGGSGDFAMAPGFQPLAPEIVGDGGSSFGVDGFRYDGQLWLYGGTGGSGGGANPQVSGPFKSGIAAPGTVLNRGVDMSPEEISRVSPPGTGGGGGGGVLFIIAENLLLRPTARLLAQGGDARQSIDLGGNGGGGAGGNIILQVRNALTIAQGAQMDVSGGTANQPPALVPGQELPLYEGNLHADNDGNIFFFGGIGGDGAHGRIRIEVEPTSLAAQIGLNENVSNGTFMVGTSLSLGLSTATRLGVGPGSAAIGPIIDPSSLPLGFNPDSISGNLILGSGSWRFHDFGQPQGTSASLLWQGADESLDKHGLPGEFSLGSRDPRQLRAAEFVRFAVPFLSTGSETHSVREVRLPYEYKQVDERGCVDINPGF